ncbi:MAG: tRNA-specific 2-thiouridylase [Candidatus Doudnabacteria bacterium]|nr:tRNA-specific 2-thiouridylase [Candidatus Doudnabacteria bacterium]
MATGHYAQIHEAWSMKHGAKNSSKLQTSGFKLTRSADEFKDQTYFIYNIKQEQLPHLLFPIGVIKKNQVRSLARKIGLPNAEKKESMGLCFVGRIRLKDFLGQKLKVKRGEILEQNGKTIGQHEGLQNYTIGQRQGIKVGAKGPYFVFKKDLKANKLYVTNNPNDERLMVKEVGLHSVNWLTNPWNMEHGTWNTKRKNPQPTTYNLTGRFRHQGELVPLSISKIKNDLYQVVFQYPQKAVALGQSLVLYKGKECLGGGVIG